MNRVRNFTDRPSILPRNGAGWIARAKLRGLTTQEQGTLLGWLAASPKSRGRDYIRAETIWRLSGGLAAYPEIQAEVTQLLNRPIPPFAAAVPLRTDP